MNNRLQSINDQLTSQRKLEVSGGVKETGAKNPCSYCLVFDFGFTFGITLTFFKLCIAFMSFDDNWSYWTFSATSFSIVCMMKI